MLLKDNLVKLGGTLFKYRSYQFFLYFGAAFLSWRHFYHTKDNFIFELICFFVALLGMAIRILSVGFVKIGTSGRNVTEQIAEELNTTGLYTIVRNPLYIGNYFIFLGVIMLTQDIKTIIIVSVLYWLFYFPIIMTEEDFLLNKFSDEYVKYTQDVNCLIPSFKNFKKTDRKFSLVTVLVREHDTMFTTMLLLLGAETIMEYFQLVRLHLDAFWIYLFAFVTFVYVILKFLKKTKRIVPQ